MSRSVSPLHRQFRCRQRRHFLRLKLERETSALQLGPRLEQALLQLLTAQHAELVLVLDFEVLRDRLRMFSLLLASINIHYNVSLSDEIQSIANLRLMSA
jgi:hypothetical protein